MTKETGTLAELNVKPRDVVSYKDRVTYTIFGWKDGECYALGEDGFPQGGALACDMDGWRIVSRASCAEDQPPATPKTWGEMTDAEKGAILLADHEGRPIDLWTIRRGWVAAIAFSACDDIPYRVRPPEPKRETVTLYGGVSGRQAMIWMTGRRGDPHDTHRITLPLLDGNIPAGTYTSEAGETIIVEEL